ncbi:MAG: LA_2272 family surface repeat-containing protein [Phocaeicola sp.]|uniref:LA_2272 family surface repeat-containing protein n=1 Tax=Phocaeicola sp. TaxID=2773926 RepID=UPI003F9F86CB
MRIKTLLLLILVNSVVSLTPIFAQNKVQKMKSSPNISLNITNSDKQSRTSYFNLGLLTNIHQLKGIGINVISSIVQRDMTGLQLAGLANITGLDATGIQIAGAVNVTGRNLKGFQLGGLMNIGGNDLNGLQISAIGNIGGRNIKGISIGGLLTISGGNTSALQLSGLANITAQNMRGMQLSGIMNVAGSSMNGFQLAGLTNIGIDRVHGLQLAGVMNVAVNTHHATQFSALANVCAEQMRGIQIGTGNYAGKLHGAQIGVINLCEGNAKGVQIGIFNHSKDTTTIKIGLVNINPHTRIQMMTYGGNLSKGNVAVRFLNHRTYTILGIGTQYLGLKKKFSGALFYRAGLHFPLTQKLSFSGDGGFYHIESFSNKDSHTPKRMYSLQPRVNVEYQISKNIALMASVGYSWTRFYNKNKLYQHKPIIELGVILF